MKTLRRFNAFYGKYLYAFVPLSTLLIAGFEVVYEVRFGDAMHILANISMGFVSLLFLNFYLKSAKQNIGYCLIEVYEFLFTVFLAMDNHVHFREITWIIFLPCAIFCLFFIVGFTMKNR